MFNKIFYFIKRHKDKGKCTLKQEKGISLVEVIVAILIISIVTLVLVRGTIMAVTVSKMNRAKTLSTAVASEKLELIKCMDYEDIEVEDINPNWPPPLDDPDNPKYDELKEYGYVIDYEVTGVEVDGVPDCYKQVEISVSKENMNMKSVSVISQIYPTKGPEEKSKYPPPENLTIKSDTGSGLEWKRKIELVWEKPGPSSDPDLDISRYHIYRDDGITPIYSPLPTSTSYTDSFVIDNNVHSYYVTAEYNDGGKSVGSIIVTTKYLRITRYSGGGPNRTVHLAWGEAPDIGIEFVGYSVYRDGVIIVGGPPYTEPYTLTSYQETIGTDNFTYYVTAIYYDEEDEVYIEGYTSNEVKTE